jgi:iron(III) transport system substrate-binding protein
MALVVVLTACGGGAEGAPDDAGAAASETPVEESPFTYTGDDRTAYLADCAAAEEGITWYTSLAGAVVDAMAGAFSDQYPDIELEVFRGEQTDIVSRVVEENQAGRLQGDVVEVTSDGFRLLAEMGVLQPFDIPSAAKASERFTVTDDDGATLGIGDRASYVGFAYNTTALPADKVPEDLMDLLDPALKGKIAITSSTTGVRFVGSVLEQLGEAKGEEFLRRLATQEIRVEAVSGAALAGLIGTGEVASSPGVFRDHVRQLEQGGSPVKWIPLEPVTANIGYSGAFKDTTSPCSSTLFLDFILGDPGTGVYEELQYSRPGEDHGFEVWVPDESFDTTDDYNTAFEQWGTMFGELFGGR